jgi:hypothetical protein
MGDMSQWPPETYFRCVEDCPYQAEVPPTTGFRAGQLHKDAAPVAPQLQFTPCEGDFGGASRSEL